MAAPIPGLGAINGTDNSDDIVGGNPNVRGGSPAPDIAPPQLHPVAQPENYFMQAPHYAAAQSQVTDNVNRLAGALSAFQPALQNFSMVQAQFQHTQADNALAPLQGLPPDQMQSALQSNPALQGIAAQRLGWTMLGNKIAEQTKSEMLQSYTNGGFDRTNGDFNQWASGFYQRDMKAYGNNPFFARGYNETYNTTLNGLRGEQTKFAMGQAQTTRNDLLNSAFSNDISNAIDQANQQGKTADVSGIMSAVTNTMATNKTIANMPRPQRAQVLMDAIGKQVDTLAADPQWEKKGAALIGLLHADRGDGAGSLYDSSVTGGQSAKLVEQIQKLSDARYGETSQTWADIRTKAANGDPTYKDDIARVQQEHPLLWTSKSREGLDWAFDRATEIAKNRADAGAAISVYNGQLQNNQVQTVIPALQDGNARTTVQPLTVQKPNGEMQTITPQQQIEQGITTLQGNIDKQFPNAANDPQQAQAKFQAELPLYAHAGVENKQWSGQMSAGYQSANIAAAAGNQISGATTQGYDTFQRISAADPAILGDHVKGDALKFYQTAAAMQAGGMDEQSALATAARAVKDGSINKSLTNDGTLSPVGQGLDESRTRQAAVSALSAATGGSFLNPFSWGANDLSKSGNVSVIADQVVKFAAGLQRNSNMDSATAITQAAKQIAPQYTMVGNQALFTGDKSVPKDFGNLAEQFKQDWSSKNQAVETRTGHTYDDLQVNPAGTGSGWYLSYKDGSTPPVASKADFSLPDLFRFQQKNAAAASTQRDSIFQRGFNDRQNSTTVDDNSYFKFPWQR